MSNSSLHQAPLSEDKPVPPTLFKRLLNPLVIMLVLFGFPYVASWYFLNSESTYSFGQLGNHGELVAPLVPLGDFALETTDGTTITNSELAGNWLLFTASKSCEKVCQDTLLLIRQARKSTGINRKVIKPVLLLQAEDALKPFDVDLSEAFPQLAIISGNKQSAKKLIDTFSKVHANVENSIYMVDPYNNLMMYYPEGIAPKALMEDMERLLKVNKPKL